MLYAFKVTSKNLSRVLPYQLSFFSEKIKSSKTIFIKPNLGGRLPIIKGENTDPQFLYTLIEALKKYGAKKIIIGHFPLLEIGRKFYSFKKIIEISGLAKLKNIKGVRFLDLEKCQRVNLKFQDFTFYIPQIIFESFYINCAKLKTHMETGVSLCIKNQMGLLPAKNKMDMHKLGLDYYLAGLSSLLKPQLNIIEGLWAMQGNGPHHGKPKKAGIIISGDKILEVDSLGCYLMGFEPSRIVHLKYAFSLAKINFPETESFHKWRKLRLKFSPPKPFLKKGFNLYIWPNKACSGCLFSLNQAYSLIKKDIFKQLKFYKNFLFKRADFVLGKEAEANIKKYKNIYLIGDCAKGLFTGKEKFIPGCPPMPSNIVKFLVFFNNRRRSEKKYAPTDKE